MGDRRESGEGGVRGAALEAREVLGVKPAALGRLVLRPCETLADDTNATTHLHPCPLVGGEELGALVHLGATVGMG